MESGQLVAGTRPAARQWLVCAAVATVLAAAWLALAPAARAACPAPAGSNAIVVENCQTGSPRSEWDMLSHTLIFHGRRVCAARKPACSACPVTAECPSAFDAELVGRKPVGARRRAATS